MGGRSAPQGWQVADCIDRSIGCSTDAQAVRPYLSWNELSYTPTLNDFHRDVHATNSVDEQYSERVQASGLPTWSQQRSQHPVGHHERLPLVGGFSEHHEGRFLRRMPVGKGKTMDAWDPEMRSGIDIAASCNDRRDHEQPIHSHIYAPEARSYPLQAAGGITHRPLNNVLPPQPHFSAQPYFTARPYSHLQFPENAQQAPFHFLPELFMRRIFFCPAIVELHAKHRIVI